MPEPFGIVFYCDDVREEVNDKQSVMGLYGARMTLSEPAPVLLPRFVIFVTLVVPANEDFQDFEISVIRVTEGDEEEIFRAKPADHLDITDLPRDQVIVLNPKIEIVPFRVTTSCLIKVNATFGAKLLELNPLRISLEGDDAGD